MSQFFTHVETATLSVPHPFKLLGEVRALADLIRMVPHLAVQSLRPNKTSTGRQIMIIPGFGGSEKAMWPLKRFLQSQGHAVHDWGFGKNLAGVNIPHTLSDLSPHWQFTAPSDYRREGGVALLCDKISVRVRELTSENSSIVLLGWSLGGFMAREVARDNPKQVSHVITLGTPVIGGPKYTAAAKFFSKRGMDLDWVEREIAKRDHQPISTPITAIVSPSDGVVDWNATIDRISPNLDSISRSAAHLGMPFNVRIWADIARVLAS
jgi:pimeloyl-ACP methyl ester carboxylesterase